MREVVGGIKGSDRVVNLAGKTSIGVLLAVMEKFSIFVANDSGPLHLAASIGIKTVSFFGPETPTLYGPMGGDSLIFYEGIYCSPCLNVFNAKTAPCSGHNICMQKIEAENVFNVMKEKFKDVLQD